METVKKKQENLMVKQRIAKMVNDGDVIEVPVLLRKANSLDLKSDNITLRYGQLYFLKSSETGEFEKDCKIIEPNTYKADIRDWFLAGMIYVPFIWNDKHVR